MLEMRFGDEIHHRLPVPPVRSQINARGMLQYLKVLLSDLLIPRFIELRLLSNVVDFGYLSSRVNSPIWTCRLQE